MVNFSRSAETMTHRWQWPYTRARAKLQPGHIPGRITHRWLSGLTQGQGPSYSQFISREEWPTDGWVTLHKGKGQVTARSHHAEWPTDSWVTLHKGKGHVTARSHPRKNDPQIAEWPYTRARAKLQPGHIPGRMTHRWLSDRTQGQGPSYSQVTSQEEWLADGPLFLGYDRAASLTTSPILPLRDGCYTYHTLLQVKWIRDKFLHHASQIEGDWEVHIKATAIVFCHFTFSYQVGQRLPERP